MKQLLLNRINIFLCFVGLFVSGVLSLQHLLDLKVPCGFTTGCDAVKNMAISKIPIGEKGIPIAILGFAMYAGLAFLAIYREFSGPQSLKATIKIGYVMSAAGALMSIGLQVYSISTHELCSWCMGHALTITLLFVVHAIQLQMENAPASGTEEVVGPNEPRSKNADLFVIALFAIALIGGLGFASVKMEKGGPVSVDWKKVEGSKADFLVPKDAHVMGPDDAPVTIVEFADLSCPTCQQTFSSMEKYIADHPGKIRYVYRHFPIFMTHRLSTSAAILAEYAGIKGKFFPFLQQAFSVDPEKIKDLEFYYGILQGLNLDVEDAKKSLLNKDSEAWNRMYADLQAGDKLGISSTPMFFLIANGEEPIAVGPNAVFDTLESPPYSDLLKGNASK